MPDEELRRRYRHFLDVTQLNHDTTFGAEAMIAGYRHCGDWLDEVVRYIAVNHQHAADFIRDQVPGVHKVPAEATYLAWRDFRETGLKQDEIMDRLVNVGGVGLYSGTEFGEEGGGFFRMNIACARSQLDHGLDGIMRAIA